MTVAIAAAIAVLTGVAAGLGIGLATGLSIGRLCMGVDLLVILGCALAEATAVYGLVIGILIIFILK